MKRTKQSKDFKLQVIKEATETGNNPLVARRYELNPNMVSRWVREYKDGKFGEVDVEGLPDLDTKKLTKENRRSSIISTTFPVSESQNILACSKNKNYLSLY